MPTPEKILEGLTYAANQYSVLAILWHVIFLALIIILFTGRKPPKKITGIILALPVISVGIIAVFIPNPFNAIIFLLAGILLLIFGNFLADENIEIHWNIFSVAGLLLIIYGWVYPHFVDGSSLFRYLYRAPTGIVPCPTLSIVIGFTLFFNGFKSKKWMFTLVVLGLFYGIFGFFRLKVYLDIGLLLGALLLGILALLPKRV